MKTFKIPVEWASYGVVEIEAKDVKQAIKMAEEENIPLPEGDYIDGTWKVNDDECLIKELNKN